MICFHICSTSVINKNLSMTMTAQTTTVIIMLHWMVLTRVGHKWELLGNYLDFIEVMVFYLFCRRTKRILVTVIRCYKIYIHIHSLMLFIQENNWVQKF